MSLIFTPKTILVLGGLIVFGIIGVISAKFYESNTDEVATLSPWIALPLVCAITYLYIDNFSFVTYIISIGAVVLLFL